MALGLQQFLEWEYAWLAKLLVLSLVGARQYVCLAQELICWLAEGDFRFLNLWLLVQGGRWSRQQAVRCGCQGRCSLLRWGCLAAMLQSGLMDDRRTDGWGSQVLAEGSAWPCVCLPALIYLAQLQGRQSVVALRHHVGREELRLVQFLNVLRSDKWAWIDTRQRLGVDDVRFDLFHGWGGSLSRSFTWNFLRYILQMLLIWNSASAWTDTAGVVWNTQRDNWIFLRCWSHIRRFLLFDSLDDLFALWVSLKVQRRLRWGKQWELEVDFELAEIEQLLVQVVFCGLMILFQACLWQRLKLSNIIDSARKDLVELSRKEKSCSRGWRTHSIVLLHQGSVSRSELLVNVTCLHRGV